MDIATGHPYARHDPNQTISPRIGDRQIGSGADDARTTGRRRQIATLLKHLSTGRLIAGQHGHAQHPGGLGSDPGRAVGHGFHRRPEHRLAASGVHCDPAGP